MISPLPATLLVAAPGAEELAELAADVVTWKRPPSSWSGGRAGWLVVPEALAGAGRRGLKLKGLGIAPVDGAPAQPPGPTLYDRWDGQGDDPHFGIGDDLEFVLRTGDPAPIGGLFAAGVDREQRCSAALAAHGVPAVGPVAAFRYGGCEVEVHGRPSAMGVSVTVSPNASDVRCSALIPYGTAAPDPDELARLRVIYDVEPTDDGPVDRLIVLGRVYEAFATSLTGLGAAGWFRYSGHPGNIAVDHEGRALLVDLDSCCELADVSEQRAGAEVIRDGMSALYNLSCIFYSQQAMAVVDDRVLVEHEPFSGFLHAWDPGAAADRNRRQGQAIARYVVAARDRLRHFDHFLGSSRREAAHLYRYVRHDRDLTFTWLYRILAHRRIERPTGAAAPWTVDGLDERLLRFAGRERFDAMWDLEAST